MLNHYKELLSWRNEIRALKDGDVAEYKTGNDGVAAYIRMTQDDSVLVEMCIRDRSQRSWRK